MQLRGQPLWPGVTGRCETLLPTPAPVAGWGAAAHLPDGALVRGPWRSAPSPPAPFRIWSQQMHLFMKGAAVKPAFCPVVHPLSIWSAGLPPTANSGPVYLRRPRLTAYRCSLPGLTVFAASRPAGPGHQRHLSETVPAAPRPRAGIRPRYSGLRVQGTAGSPSSTTGGHPITRPPVPVKTSITVLEKGRARL